MKIVFLKSEIPHAILKQNQVYISVLKLTPTEKVQLGYGAEMKAKRWEVLKWFRAAAEKGQGPVPGQAFCQNTAHKARSVHTCIGDLQSLPSAIHIHDGCQDPDYAKPLSCPSPILKTHKFCVSSDICTDDCSKKK